MIALAFSMPFYGRCVSPNPEPQPARFEKGDRVIWLADREEGFVAAVTEYAVCIHWDESQWTGYPLHSVAARENIVVLGKEDDAE